MNQPKSRVLEAAVGPAVLLDIDAALDRLWAANPHVPPTVRMHMGIAAAEIAANIVEHCGAHRRVQVWMDVSVLPSQVWVEFTDDGDPVVVDLAAVQMPGDEAERGRGLALAQTVLEQLTYQRTHLNHWTLVSKPFG